MNSDTSARAKLCPVPASTTNADHAPNCFMKGPPLILVAMSLALLSCSHGPSSTKARAVISSDLGLLPAGITLCALATKGMAISPVLAAKTNAGRLSSRSAPTGQQPDQGGNAIAIIWKDKLDRWKLQELQLPDGTKLSPLEARRRLVLANTNRIQADLSR